MSTPGKVLVAVVLLALIGWIFLFAQVAQLNINWGKRIDELTTQIADLEASLTQTRATIDTRLAEVTRSQEQRDRKLTVLRARLSDAEKLQALNQEAAVRVEQQLQLLQSSIAAAQKASADRLAERRQTEQAKTEAEAEVEQLKVAVTQRLETLDDLRRQFQETLAENAQLLQQFRRGNGTSRDDARTRSALLSR